MRKEAMERIDTLCQLVRAGLDRIEAGARFEDVAPAVLAVGAEMVRLLSTGEDGRRDAP